MATAPTTRRRGISQRRFCSQGTDRFNPNYHLPPVLQAIDKRDTRYLRPLPKAGAKLETADGSALQRACRANHPEAISLLLSAGARVPRKKGEDPLLISLLESDQGTAGDRLAAARRLLAAGVKTHGFSRSGHELGYYLQRHADEEALVMLLAENGGPVPHNAPPELRERARAAWRK